MVEYVRDEPGEEVGRNVRALAIFCTGGPDVIPKEAWPFYRKMSGFRLCWELEEPKGLTGRVLRGRPYWDLYGGISLIRNSAHLGKYGKIMPTGVPRSQETHPS